MEPELLFIYMIYLRIIYKFQIASFLPTSIVYNAQLDLHALHDTIFTISVSSSVLIRNSLERIQGKTSFSTIIIIVTFAYSYRNDEWKLVPFTRGSDLFSDAGNRLRRKRVKHGCCLIRGSGWIQRVRRFYWVRFTLDLGWTDTCNHVSSGKSIASFRMLAQCREQGSKEKEMIIIITR